MDNDIMPPSFYNLLKEFYNGYKMSEQDFQDRFYSLPIDEKQSFIEAKEFVAQTQSIEALTPNNIDNNTKFVISQEGKRRFDYVTEKYEKRIHEKEKQIRVDKLQLQLLVLSIETNISTKATNESLQHLNDKVIPENFIAQRKIGNRTLMAIVASALFSLASVLAALELRETQTPLLLQQQVKYLDSLQQSLRSIDTSLRKTEADLNQMKDSLASHKGIK